MPRVASRVRSRQPAWAASAARRGPSARQNGCRKLQSALLQGAFEVNCRVGGSARAERALHRVIAQSALYRALGTQLRAKGARHRVIMHKYLSHSAQGATPSSRHRACGAHNTCMPGRGRYRGARREKLQKLRCRALARGKGEPVLASSCIVMGSLSGRRRPQPSKACPVCHGAWAVRRAATGLPDRRMC